MPQVHISSDPACRFSPDSKSHTNLRVLRGQSAQAVHPRPVPRGCVGLRPLADSHEVPAAGVRRSPLYVKSTSTRPAVPHKLYNGQ